jgi:adenosine kinase
VVFFGCVGKDKNAEILQSANEEAGVAVRYLYDPKQPTGRCGAIITGHSRSLCTDLAAANCYKLEHLMENWKVVENAKAYYVGGYHLTVCVPAALALAEEAAKTNKPFIFSLSAPFIPEVFKEPLDKIAPFWDYIVGNETEALSYANSHDLGTEDLPAIARAIANLPKKNDKRKRVAIITQGTDPTIVAVQGESESDVKTFQVRPIPRAEIVDTTGAGDAFLGGFIAGIVEHAGLEKSIDMGQWLAALSIRELGPW